MRTEPEAVEKKQHYSCCAHKMLLKTGIYTKGIYMGKDVASTKSMQSSRCFQVSDKLK